MDLYVLKTAASCSEYLARTDYPVSLTVTIISRIRSKYDEVQAIQVHHGNIHPSI